MFHYHINHRRFQISHYHINHRRFQMFHYHINHRRFQMSQCHINQFISMFQFIFTFPVLNCYHFELSGNPTWKYWSVSPTFTYNTHSLWSLWYPAILQSFQVTKHESTEVFHLHSHTTHSLYGPSGIPLSFRSFQVTQHESTEVFHLHSHTTHSLCGPSDILLSFRSFQVTQHESTEVFHLQSHTAHSLYGPSDILLSFNPFRQPNMKVLKCFTYNHIQHTVSMVPLISCYPSVLSGNPAGRDVLKCLTVTCSKLSLCSLLWRIVFEQLSFNYYLSWTIVLSSFHLIQEGATEMFQQPHTINCLFRWPKGDVLKSFSYHYKKKPI